jgi:hypothetical protein
VLLYFLLFGPPRRSTPAPSESPRPTVQSERHTNDAAGYSFLQPPGWVVSDRETVSDLESPDGDVIVSFGLAPEGSLEEATAALAGSINDAYEDVQVSGPERQDMGEHRAVVVGGNAVNEAGVPIRFLALTLRLEGQNYAISVFVADASDPVKVLPPVEDIIASFDSA